MIAEKTLNRTLHVAKSSKKDEFYTQLSDIESELKHYTQHFKNKVVFCNCDDPRQSNFFKYFAYNFENLGLKKLITTCYKNQETDLFFEEESEKAVFLEYNGDLNGNKIPDAEEIGVKPLIGDGDFRSRESIDLLKQSDIVVTNPPFSLFREFLAWIVEADKKFVIIGNMNAITYKEVFPLIQDNKMWTGSRFNKRLNGKNMTFTVPDDYTLSGTEVEMSSDGKKMISVAGTGWFTNLDHGIRHQFLPLMTMADNIKFSKHKEVKGREYQKYDNYDAIEVPFTDAIPSDYDGVMGVPISFLPKYNPDQFIILGATQRGCHDKVPDTKKYDDYWEVKQNGEKTGSSGGKTNENANLEINDGKKNYFINKEGHIVQSAYQRIFIKHKK